MKSRRLQNFSKIQAAKFFGLVCYGTILPNPSYCTTKPQLNHMLASGEANVASPEPIDGFLYNSASTAFNDEFRFKPLFMEHNFNRNGQSTISRVEELSRMSELRASREVENLIGKNLHLDSLFGFSFLSNQFTFASIASFSYDSIIRGTGLPVLELNITETVETFFSYSKFLGHGFSLGLTLSPIYRLEYHTERSTAEIAEDKKVLNPMKNGNRGLGIGNDIGFSWYYDLSKYNYFMIGSSLFDLGSTNFRVLRYTKETPSPIPMSGNTGITIHMGSAADSVLKSVKLMYSYYYLETYQGKQAPPHRIGLRAEFKYGFELLMGLYKNYPSAGIQFSFLNIMINYISFFESASEINYRSYDHRHGVSLHSIF